jgi:tetratricopeptide (TPR) repeat protein
LRELPFDQLVASDPELLKARRDHAELPPPVRREAADWAYHNRIADSLFENAVRRTGAGPEMVTRHEPGVVALAIDPLFAPALLTVGSLEYQLGRHNAAMQMFQVLVALPAQEPDLVQIVEQAAALLLDDGDVDRARQLYQQAADRHPGVATYWSGIGYCLVRCGRLTEAVNVTRRAVALEPANPVLLNDLGWALVEAGEYSEARPVLQKAVTLAAPDFDLPRQNLAELETRVPCRPACPEVTAP